MSFFVPLITIEISCFKSNAMILKFIIFFMNVFLFLTRSLNCFFFLLFFVRRLDYTNDYSEQWPPVCSILNRNVRRMYNNRKQIVMNRLPFLKWVPTYKLSYLFYDFIAGLTVGLTAIPQGIAYAIVAGLPPQYGLYSGFIGSFVYLIFGSSKDVTIGKLRRLSVR